MTFNESAVIATCCKLDRTPVSVSCGKGLSCTASCFAMDTTLCPSHDCEACNNFEQSERRARNSYVTGGSSALNHCVRNGCRVRGRFKSCCFHSKCRRLRERQCSWLHYLVGEFILKKTNPKHFTLRSQMHEAWSNKIWPVDMPTTRSASSRNS